MRYAIIADIHSNLPALQAVLSDIEKYGVDEIVCAGDVVGYGPFPNECIEIVEKTVAHTVMGNHDCAILDTTELKYFNTYAREAIEWTLQVLIPKSVQFLSSLGMIKILQDFTLVHSSPSSPGEWLYIFSLTEARKNFEHFRTPICFIGHSHIPTIFCHRNERCWVVRNTDIAIEPDTRYIINVGSVGQPRDADPRASYGIYNTETQNFTLHRVSYDIQTTQTKMAEMGLPTYLIKRLSYGR